MADKVIYAMYNDDDVLKNAAKSLVEKGVKITDVFSPFPIHGIDPIIGIKRTRLAIVSFMFGLGGLALSLLGIWYFNIFDWAMNIGGKPSFNLYENIPAFIPVVFEFTVLCAAHGMAISYLIRNKTLPGMPSRSPDTRTTDDKFVMEIRTAVNHGIGADQLSELVKSTDVYEYNEKDA